MREEEIQMSFSMLKELKSERLESKNFSDRLQFIASRYLSYDSYFIGK